MVHESKREQPRTNILVKSLLSLTWLLFFLSAHTVAAASPSALEPGLEPSLEPGLESRDEAYYTITNSAQSSLSGKKVAFQDPGLFLHEGMQSFVSWARTAAFQLMKWQRHEGPQSLSPEPYDRKKHFGSWVSDRDDETCYSTRVQVLIRDSKTPVEFNQNDHCKVASGTWDDPYTGRQITKAGEIDIDHMVPLKNAFEAGAWKWKYKERCLFGNFTANNYHLISVGFQENRIKGDSGPDEYLPPNRAYVCQYLKNWLRIKLIWKLEINSAEAQAIQEAVQKQACEIKEFKMTPKELAQQRQAMIDSQDLCSAGDLQIEGSGKGLPGLPETPEDSSEKAL